MPNVNHRPEPHPGHPAMLGHEWSFRGAMVSVVILSEAKDLAVSSRGEILRFAQDDNGAARFRGRKVDLSARNRRCLLEKPGPGSGARRDDDAVFGNRQPWEMKATGDGCPASKS